MTHDDDLQAGGLGMTLDEVRERYRKLRKYPGMLGDPTCPCDTCAASWQQGSDANMLYFIVLPMLERLFRIGAHR